MMLLAVKNAMEEREDNTEEETAREQRNKRDGERKGDSLVLVLYGGYADMILARKKMLEKC